MQTITIIFFTIMFLFSGNMGGDIKNPDSINPIIGNLSYLVKYGKDPAILSDEKLRIQTHFEYVGRILNSKSQGAIPTHLLKTRQRMMALLREYSSTGLFPKNYDCKNERKPCFIDRDGTICAVGYLVAKTAGMELANKINAAYQYSEILDIDSPELLRWIKESGLTLKEVAMIQPKYRPVEGYSYISPGYGAASGVLGGANMALSAMNIAQLSQPERSKELQIIGLVTGIASATLGLANIRDDDYWGGSNQGRKTLSMVNIAVGTASMCISGYSLFTNRKKKNALMSWNVYCYPDEADQVQFGFNLTRKI